MLSSSSMNTPYEEVLQEIRALRKENAELREKIRQLEEQINLNSKNSSKPPSADKKPSSKIRKKNGAKPGHPGHFRSLFPVEQVHQFVTLKTDSCPKCKSLVRPTGEKPSIHQQVEIPEVCCRVTQYERHAFYCPCCRTYGVAALPPEVGSSAFGTRLTAFTSFLTGACRLSKRLALQVLHQGFGIKAAVGSASNFEQRISTALRVPYENIKTEVRSSPDTKHVDETGWRQWGKAEFLWVMSTKKAALYKIQAGRNSECRDSLLGDAKWTKAAFVTDRFAVYSFQGFHQYCLAHLIRDLKRFAERKGLDGEWGSMMLELLDKVFEFWKDFREKRRTRKSLQMGSQRYRDEFEYGLLLAAMKNRHSISLRRFAKNLVNKTRKLWVFIEQEGVEPTNNQAERDLRSAVIWRKICHGTKSNRGDRFVERIQSVVATLARQGERCLNFLSEALFSAKMGRPAPNLFQAVCKTG